MVKPSLHITTRTQFPLFQPDLPVGEQRKDLNAGPGVVTFDGPQGPGFYKGGHDGQTANTMVCVERKQRCALILSNDVRSEAGFAELTLVLIFFVCLWLIRIDNCGCYQQDVTAHKPTSRY